MEIIKTKIPGVIVFQPEIFLDERGYLIESYNEFFYKDLIEDVNFVQDNESKSKYGVLRGLHFQKKPFEQAKLIRVVRGEIQDVVVDIRPNSTTFKKYFSIILNDQNRKQIYVPRGFAHGFLVLSKEAIVVYKLDTSYNSDYSDGLMYNDPSIGISWKLNDKEIILSKKDKKWKLLK